MNEKLKKLLLKQQETMQQMAKAIKTRDKQIETMGAANEQTAKSIEKLGEQYEELTKEVNEQLKSGGFGGAGGPEVKSVGQKFAESDVFKKAQGEHGVIQRGVPVQVGSFHKDLTSATTGAGNGGALLTPMRLPGWIDETERQLSIRDLLAKQSITTSAIEYVRVIDFENNADIRPEGAHAPKSDIAFELKTESVKSISHWMAATREILNDEARLRAFIDQKLRYGVKAAEDQKLLYGDGTNGNFTGLMVDEDVKQFSRYQANDKPIDILRRSLTDIRLTDIYSASGIILNPVDWEEIELAKGSDGHYIWLNIGQGNQQTVFRMPIIDTPAMEQGHFLTGNFQAGGTIYDREAANVRFSESHEDFFTKNMLAIMAEERLAFAIERPKAFVKGTFEAPAPGGGE